MTAGEDPINQMCDQSTPSRYVQVAARWRLYFSVLSEFGAYAVGLLSCLSFSRRELLLSANKGQPVGSVCLHECEAISFQPVRSDDGRLSVIVGATYIRNDGIGAAL